MAPTENNKAIGEVLEAVAATISSRKAELPDGSYTTYLFTKGIDKILKKVGEEAAETIIAAKNEHVEPLVSEISDLLYHLLVLMAERGIDLQQLADTLAAREGRTAEAKYNLNQNS